MVRASEGLVARVLENPELPILKLGAPEEATVHAFPLLRVTHLFETLRRMGRAQSLDDRRLRRALEERLHLHLSLSTIENSDFDAGELTFALEGWLLTHPGQPDGSIIAQAFSVMKDRQELDPYWRPLKPFKVTPQGLVLLPQSVEIANSLLRTCTLAEEKDYFSENIALFRTYARWLESRQCQGRTIDGATFIGWESEHTHVPDRVHLWQTSQALLCLLHYDALLQKHVARTLLRLSGASYQQDMSPSVLHAEPVSSAGHAYATYSRIREVFVTASQPARSLLLYGPPGTGKSTAVSSIAAELRMGMVTVTPSDFISAGPTEIEARSKGIFQMLTEQTRTVALLDEIDRLLLDRDSRWYNAQGDLFQLLTPGMLTKLSDLRTDGRLIFVIATNYEERIDPALTRTGRIDLRLPLLPPDTAGREAALSAALGEERWKKVSKGARRRVLQETALMTVSELKTISTEALQSVASEGSLGDRLDAVLSKRSPSIRIASYKTRVDPSKEGRRPLEELALLCYLMLEAGKALSQEEWLTKALVEALQTQVLRDGGVATAIENVVAAR